MKIKQTTLPGVVLIKPDVFRDRRGYFMEAWNARHYSEAGIDAGFVQDNLSQSARYTLRGLHYQVEQPQGKLVRVVLGEVFDVVVDLRRSSQTFGQWYGAMLSEENKDCLWIPPGFAHGFLVTSDTAVFEYKCTDYYAPEHERAVRWNDPDIGIEWPLADGREPILSGKDAAAPMLGEADTYS